MKEKEAELIKDSDLINAGWVKLESPICAYEKKIPNNNPINNSEDSDISIILHSDYGEFQFGVMFPDGGVLNLKLTTMEELNSFERMIDFYDPNF